MNSRQLPIERILQPFEEFIHLEASGGVFLLLCAVLALIWANSPWSSTYTSLWQTQLAVGLGGFSLAKPLLLWINDGLMAIFFFVVGLEIKREVLVGELASLQQAALPIAAAMGGMVLPAITYVALNSGKPGITGWGIPMATDIAFALGIFALLGKRGAPSLKVFLTALAIVDDIFWHGVRPSYARLRMWAALVERCSLAKDDMQLFKPWKRPVNMWRRRCNAWNTRYIPG